MARSAPLKRQSRSILLGVTSHVSLPFLEGIATTLLRRGWSVHVVSSPLPSEIPASFPDGVAVHEIPMVREPSPTADLRALWEWVWLLSKIRPDAVMVGTPKAGLLGTLAGAVVRVPVRVYQIRGLRLETARGLPRAMYHALERLTVRLSTERLAVSSSLARRYYSLRLASQKRHPVKVIGRGSSKGVNTAKFGSATKVDEGRRQARERWGIEMDVPIIGYVGRLHEDKGLRELDAASRLLQEQGLDHRVVIIGSSEGDELADSLRKNPRVVLVGPSSKVEDEYVGMDVFCLPTYREGFPNVVLEASASGLPVVTTDATGAVDSVEDGATGLIVRAGDEEHLAKGLSWLLQHPEDAKRMGAKGAQHVAEHFEEAVVLGKLANWLEGLVEARASKR